LQGKGAFTHVLSKKYVLPILAQESFGVGHGIEL
jgi:hypothetical protein